MYQAVLCGYLFNSQKTDKFKTTFGESEDVRNKIQEYNNNVMVNRVTKKDGQSSDIHDVTLSLITNCHIYEVLRVPDAYHSQVVDKIITNESGGLLTAKETKKLVDDICEKIANLQSQAIFQIHAPSPVPTDYRY